MKAIMDFFRQCCGAPGEAGEKSPLLNGIPSPANLLKSARPQRRKINNNDDGSLREVDIQPTSVTSVDKSMQDHGKLYNDYFERYRTIDKMMTSLCEAYPEENTHKSLHTTMCIIQSRAGGYVTVQRKHKYCMQIYCDDDFKEGLTLDYVNTFNDVNNTIRHVIEKGSGLKNTVNLVLKDEKVFRRDVLAASLGPNGPDCMKNCIEGIAELKLIPKFIDEIVAEAKKTFDGQLLLATKAMCEEKVSLEKVERLMDASLSMNNSSTD